MKVNLEKNDDLTALLEFELEKSDYEKEYLQELKKYQAKATLKGFRKGKTPMGFIKKMYGKSVLAEQINKKLQESLYKYLQDEKIDILGDPLPNKDQQEIDFDAKELSNFKFKFDLGLSPEFEVEGVSTEDSYSKNLVSVTDAMIDEEILAYRKQLGESKETEDAVADKDLVKLQAEEAGSGVLADGWACEFTVSVDLLNDDVKSKIIGLKKDDTIEFDIYNLEKDKDEAYVKKYLLQVPEEEADREIGKDFVGKIVEIKRLELAELNTEFFDKLFGKDEIGTEEALRTKIKENIYGFYNKQATSLMYRDIMQVLVEKNTMELPDTFLKRWLKETNEGMDDAKLEGEYEGFQENLKWTLIKTKLAKRFEVEVKPEEIRGHLTEKVKGYFGGYGQVDSQYIDTMVNQLTEDRTQVQNAYNEIEADKLFAEIEKNITVAETTIDADAFKELVQQANEQHKKEN